MKRNLIVIAAFVLIGTIINVAVAWVCFAHHVHGQSSISRNPPTRTGALGSWPFRSPAGWPESAVVEESLAFGFRDVSAQHASASGAIFLIGEGPNGRAVVTHRMVLIQAGWPMLSLQSRWLYCFPGEDAWEETGTLATRYDFGIYVPAALFGIKDADSVLMPVRLCWPGFFINTSLYAGALWSMTLGPFAVRRILRKRRGACVRCGYDRTGNTSGCCPECGATFGASSDAPSGSSPLAAGAGCSSDPACAKWIDVA